MCIHCNLSLLRVVQLQSPRLIFALIICIVQNESSIQRSRVTELPNTEYLFPYSCIRYSVFGIVFGIREAELCQNRVFDGLCSMYEDRTGIYKL